MSQPIHTFGCGCDFAPPSSSEQVRKPCDEMPPMRAQFFYCSPLPLDDPLTAVPPPTADSKNIKHPPRPFPKCDNKALLDAWLGMGSKRDRRSHNRTCRPKLGIEPMADKKFGAIGLRPKIKQETKDFKESLKPTTVKHETCQPTTHQSTNSGTAGCCQQHIAAGKGAKSALEMIGCPCKGSHLWCRKKMGACMCTTCPKAPQDAVAETQTCQPHILPQRTEGIKTFAEPTPKSEPGEDIQQDTLDQMQHPKQREPKFKRGKSERERSGREFKPENPEPESSSDRPPEDSARKVRKPEKSKQEYSRPAEPLSPLKHRREASKERQPDKLQPECSSTEEEPEQDKAYQTNRSKHWEHNCRKGRSEREGSGRESKPADNTVTEPPKDKEPVTKKKKSKNKGKAAAIDDQGEDTRTEKKSKNKGKAAAIDDQGEDTQTEKTKAWFDQQLQAQLRPISASFCRDHSHKTEDSEDSQDEEGACCAEFDCKEKKDGINPPGSIIPSCCGENTGDSLSKRQKSEAESNLTFSGSCVQSKDNGPLKRNESQAESIFSDVLDKTKDSNPSHPKNSEAETILSGNRDKSKTAPSKETEANTAVPSCCDESKGNVSHQDQPEAEYPTRLGSCCDPLKQDDRQIVEKHASKKAFQDVSECCTELERGAAAATIHDAFHNKNQLQHSSGPCAHMHASNGNQFEHSTGPSAHNTHSHHSHLQNSNGPSLHMPTSHDKNSGHSTIPPVQSSNRPSRNINKSKPNDNQPQHLSEPSEADTCVEPKLAMTSKNSKGKGRFSGRRQADGTTDHDDGLYDDSDEDLSTDYIVRDQGDSTNDKCTCDSYMLKPEPNLPVARNGNAYIKSGKVAGSGTTGKPFVKLPARGENPAPQYGSTTYSDEPSTDPQKSHERDSTEDMEVEGCKAYKHQDHAKCQVEVPVGTCRLHSVRLPCLVVQPIYWSPLNDQYPCIYGTWFYKDTMCPVEPAVANQLEKGYRANECWSKTWDDQLNSAIDVGPEGEEKIVHRLWPNEKDSKTSTFDASEHIFSTDPYCAARCFYGEAAAEGKVEESDAKQTAATSINKKYPNSQVIYKNCEEAFILKPSLCPSAYYSRRPLTKIKNGVCVGIAVVRGFNRRAWNKLYPSKRLTTVTKSPGKTAKHCNSCSNTLDACPACKMQDEIEKVTDICLVVHGIGQKLSERMESFNFTYAVNSFRCEMKRELTNEDVKKVLREEFCGVTVLPVNWRANLSFEDGGPRKPGDKDRVGCDYSLNDITQPTIPRVRELISDVMLDIPYYMSGHKPKMIAALIAEANRIYRLWCKNNPGFHKSGRVHLISHSLGSVMALEVLSRQPTTLPAELSWRPNTKYFDFQTTNCFLAGSPCAFFLLLESKSLVPRKGIHKPGCECENGNTKDVFGDVGAFGCLAIDNLYNIMHCNDPIAYRLNACVDSRYAACLKQAEVPDSSRSFMTAVTQAMKSATGMSQNEEISVGEMPRLATIAKMPCQMEMEVHDFTAEEMAEKKFCQLNENGQVDWILGNRPGILANQYIDMLSAHSSYWNNKDFIRFLCVEIGRRPGKMNTLPNMRARKKSQK